MTARLLRPANAAEYVGLATGTLANLRCRGGGPPFRKIAGRVRYDVSDLDLWIEGHPRLSSTSQASTT